MAIPFHVTTTSLHAIASQFACLPALWSSSIWPLVLFMYTKYFAKGCDNFKLEKFQINQQKCVKTIPIILLDSRLGMFSSLVDAAAVVSPLSPQGHP